MRHRPAMDLVVYRAADGWRWRLRSAGRVVADSGQAYGRNRDCAMAARNTFKTGRRIRLHTHDRGRWTEEMLP